MQTKDSDSGAQPPLPAPRLADFLALPLVRQLEFVETVDLRTLLVLHNRYVAWAERVKDGPLDADVFALMLRRLNPLEYDECFACENDPKLAEARENLRPQALQRMKTDFYETRVREVLADPEEQAKLLAGPKDELHDWAKTLERYARQYGRSKACRDLQERIREAVG